MSVQGLALGDNGVARALAEAQARKLQQPPPPPPPGPTVDDEIEAARARKDYETAIVLQNRKDAESRGLS